MLYSASSDLNSMEVVLLLLCIHIVCLFFYKEEFLLRKFSKKTIYIYNIVITVELQMGHTLYIIKIIVSIMNH